jgi:hypothetical protein
MTKPTLDFKTLFVTTDADGDKLAVEYLTGGDERPKYVVTVSGEDGHRAVVLDDADVEDLISTLRQHRTQTAPPVAPKAKRAPARRRPLTADRFDGLDGLRSLLP